MIYIVAFLIEKSVYSPMFLIALFLVITRRVSISIGYDGRKTEYDFFNIMNGTAEPGQIFPEYSHNLSVFQSRYSYSLHSYKKPA